MAILRKPDIVTVSKPQTTGGRPTKMIQITTLDNTYAQIIRKIKVSLEVLFLSYKRVSQSTFDVLLFL